MKTLAEMTTLRVGGPARRVVDTQHVDDFVAAIRHADDAGEPLLVLGGGSNVLVADRGFDGVVVRDQRRDIVADDRGDHVLVTAAAGVVWDDLVATAVTNGWAGVSSLSGIPGSVGATPVQNVGAYGSELADVVVSLSAWDREEHRLCTMVPSDLEFGYRTSVLKQTMMGVTPRWVVVDVTLRLEVSDQSDPVRYAQLADTLDVEVGTRAPIDQVRATVLSLRRSKGMVLDPADHDTWSAGSFFTNPVLGPSEAARLPADAPRHLQPDGVAVKTSAAWLIHQSGFAPGHGLPGPASLSTRHTLAITNRGDATAADLVALARQLRDGVQQRFGITLVNEPMLIGTSLAPLTAR